MPMSRENSKEPKAEHGPVVLLHYYMYAIVLGAFMRLSTEPPWCVQAFGKQQVDTNMRSTISNIIAEHRDHM